MVPTKGVFRVLSGRPLKGSPSPEWPAFVMRFGPRVCRVVRVCFTCGAPAMRLRGLRSTPHGSSHRATCNAARKSRTGQRQRAGCAPGAAVVALADGRTVDRGEACSYIDNDKRVKSRRAELLHYYHFECGCLRSAKLNPAVPLMRQGAPTARRQCPDFWQPLRVLRCNRAYGRRAMAVQLSARTSIRHRVLSMPHSMRFRSMSATTCSAHARQLPNRVRAACLGGQREC